jgi:putative ABC transport system substrate-binding protein
LPPTIDPPYRSGMDRRSFLVTSLAGVIAAPLGAEAQREEKAWQVGVLGNSPSPHLDAAFRQGLRERGWIEGRNITLLYRYSEGRN